MSYWRYWDLQAAPFAGEINRPLFRGPTFEEASARLEFLICNRRNCGLLSGPSGTGKSSMLRHLASQNLSTEDSSPIGTLRVSLLGLQPGELVRGLASHLVGSRSWIKDTRNVLSAWNCVDDYFRAASCENRHHVLLLDDVESASIESEMDVLRLLSMSFSLTVVIASDSSLLSKVSRSLLDHVDLQVEASAWSADETVEFLAWSIARVGDSNPIFTDAAVERIYEESAGVPRKIIQLADLALVAGAVAATDCIDSDLIDQVAYELPRQAA